MIIMEYMSWTSSRLLVDEESVAIFINTHDTCSGHEEKGKKFMCMLVFGYTSTYTVYLKDEVSAKVTHLLFKIGHE